MVAFEEARFDLVTGRVWAVGSGCRGLWITATFQEVEARQPLQLTMQQGGQPQRQQERRRDYSPHHHDGATLS